MSKFESIECAKKEDLEIIENNFQCLSEREQNEAEKQELVDVNDSEIEKDVKIEDLRINEEAIQNDPESVNEETLNQ